MADSAAKTPEGLPPLKIAENKQLTEKEIRELKEYTDLFNKIDVDGDGVISKEDFRTAIKKYGYQATEVKYYIDAIIIHYISFLLNVVLPSNFFLIKLASVDKQESIFPTYLTGS